MSIFIGREQDVKQLGEYMRGALQGKGKVVFIVGEAGIGKTRLIEEFKTRYLDARNAAMQSQKTSKVSPDIRFAEAKCNELAGKGEAYAPFFEIIAQFVADDKAFGSSKLAEIVREVGSDWFELVPVIGKALSLISKTFFKWRKSDDVRQLAEREVQKDKLVQEFTHILKRMSDEHPLVLFLDDLHWADESSISLLFHIARHLQAQRMLILGTYRPADIEAARGDKAHPLKDVVYELHRYDLCATIKLGYLTQAHIQDFLDAYLGKHALDAAFVTYLHDLTEGNPLFVTEYVKLLQEIGKLAQTDGAWRLQGRLTDHDMPIPTSVEKVIEKRVERLKEELQKTLKYASVNGEQFNTLVLAKLLNWDGLELLEKLEALSRVHQLVKEITLAPGQTPRGAVYQFIHSLVQKSLYATLSAGIKSKLHAKAAEILEEVYHDDLATVAEELVEHHSRGQNHAHAAKYALLAARKANRQAGFHEARTHAQRGLEFLKTANPTHPLPLPGGEFGGGKTPLLGGARGGSDQVMLRLHIELLLELASAEEAVGETKNSIDHAENAAKLAEMVNDQSFQGEALFQVGTILYENRATTIEKTFQVLEKALAFKIATSDHEGIFKVLEKMREPAWSLRKGDDFIKRCQEVIQPNQQTQHEHLTIAILKLIAMMFYNQGKYQEAYDSVSGGLNIALTIDNLQIQIELLERLTVYAVRLKNLDKAFEHYVHAKRIANTITNMEIKDKIFYNLAEIAWYVSEYDESLENYRIAREAACHNGNLNAEEIILSRLVTRCRNIGLFDKAIQYGMHWLEISQKLGRVNLIIGALSSLGYIFREQGNYAKALEMHQQAAVLSRQYEREIRLAGDLITCQIDMRLLGRFREAIETNKEAIRICQKMKNTAIEIDYLSNLAINHLYLGQIQEVFSSINQAILLNQTFELKNRLILLSMRHGHILINTGQYKEAYLILENAVNECIRKDERYGDTPVYLMDSVKVHLAFNKVENALVRLEQLEKYFRNFVFMDAIAMLKDAYAQVYLAQGELAKAETSLNEAIALFQQMHSFRLGEADLTLAALRLAQNQPDAALQAAADAHNIFQEIEYYRRGEAILYEAKSHLALRHFSETRASLAAANAIFTRQQQPHHVAAAKLVEGQLLLAESGDTAQALTLFTAAKITFAELGLKRLENEAVKNFKSLEDF